MENKIVCSAVIVAGGNGTRMNTKEKKQFIMLKNAPVLIHTVKNISKSSMVEEIVVVAPSDKIRETKEMLDKYGCLKVKKVVGGGETRAASVKCGLDALEDNCDVIMIHDGVRPFIKKEIAENCIKDAYTFGGAVVGVDVKDTVVISDKNNRIEKLLDRNTLTAVQTPQCFRSEIIKKAYENYDTSLTDDASQVIKNGGSVHITLGDFINIKITTFEDLTAAEKYLEQGEF